MLVFLACVIECLVYSKIPIPFRSLPYTSPFIDLVCRNLYLLPSSHAKVIAKSAMLIVGWQEVCFGFPCV